MPVLLEGKSGPEASGTTDERQTSRPAKSIGTRTARWMPLQGKRRKRNEVAVVAKHWNACRVEIVAQAEAYATERQREKNEAAMVA
jgi:hypothetical protein